jgi:lipoprotein-releasing system permease protein
VTVATADRDDARPALPADPVGARAFSPFEWMLAWRYLRARRREGVISVIAGFSFLGILLGVATLIIVMAVMNGFRKELFSKILGFNGHVLVQGIDRPLVDFEEVTARLSAVAGARLVIPFVEGQGFASGSVPGQGSGVLVRGVREADLTRIPSVAGNVRSGTLAAFDERESIAIGRRLAANLGAQVGDRVTLLGPDGPRTPFGSTPRRKSYPVGAIFEIGMSELDSLIVFLPLAEAQAFFDQPDRATAIEVYADDPDAIDGLRASIHRALERPVILTDWRQRNATFFNALQVERNVMFLILTLIVLVASLNIVSGLIMLVKDKSRDIAILRTMGATRGAILRVFLITGAAIGVVGTTGGLALGTLVCAYVEEIRQFISWVTTTQVFAPELYFLSRLPAEMNPREVVSVVVMALTLSLLATLYPAWRAARLDPVEALRYE